MKTNSIYRIITVFSMALFSVVADANTTTSQWTVFDQKDDMTGEASNFAHSAIVKPMSALKFPYNDLTSWLGVGSDKKSHWAYIGFNGSPNLTGGDTKDGYNLFKLSVRVDDDPVITFYATQDWGSQFVHIRQDDEFIGLLKAGNNIKIQFPVYGNTRAVFNYSLSGSTKTISSVL